MLSNADGVAAPLKIGPHTIMQGDCLERLREIPDGSVDLILTDPPYGMAWVSNRRKVAHRSIAGDQSLEWLEPMLEQAARVLKPDSAAYFFCSWHFICQFKMAVERHFKLKNVLTWEKNLHGTGDLKGDFAPKTEFVLFAVKGRPLIRGGREPNVFRFAKTANALHPTQKPVDLCEYLVSKFSDEGQTVLDPFMGSGTTGVACARTGRNFIGIELDPTYYLTSAMRIAAEVGL